MDLTKYTHSCITLDAQAGRVVIDPGIWAEPEAAEGAGAVLITHEHSDHVDVQRVTEMVRRDSALRVYAPAAVVALMPEVGGAAVAVAPGDSFEVAGVAVDVVGGDHAEVYGGLPGCPNVGYVLQGSVYHPGDSFHVPDRAVPTVLVPTSAPWLKVGEVIDYLMRARPQRAYSIHDALLSERGGHIVDKWLTERGGTDYRRLRSGETVSI